MLAPERDDEKVNLASLLLARANPAEAAKLLGATVRSGDSEGQFAWRTCCWPVARVTGHAR